MLGDTFGIRGAILDWCEDRAKVEVEVKVEIEDGGTRRNTISPPQAR